MKTYRIICIDDDEQFIQSLESVLPEKVDELCPDFECLFEFATTTEELFGVLEDSSQSGSLGMIISDQMMTGISGLDLIERRELAVKFFSQGLSLFCRSVYDGHLSPFAHDPKNDCPGGSSCTEHNELMPLYGKQRLKTLDRPDPVCVGSLNPVFSEYQGVDGPDFLGGVIDLVNELDDFIRRKPLDPSGLANLF